MSQRKPPFRVVGWWDDESKVREPRPSVGVKLRVVADWCDDPMYTKEQIQTMFVLWCDGKLVLPQSKPEAYLCDKCRAWHIREAVA